MHAHRLVVASSVLLLVLTGCASGASGGAPGTPAADAADTQATASPQSSDSDAATEASEITIPSGAYAASAAFPFPVPEGWAVLDDFVEGTLGKDVTMDGSVEYPGDAKEAAATYLGVLKDAGFDAYTYAPGEITNPASLAAEGVINGTLYLTILNFDVHADGLQRVSITAAERD